MPKAVLSDPESWAQIDAQLNKYPQEFVAEAFWHLDQVGAILISIKDTDPNLKDTSGVTIVPLPVNHKIVLQR